MGINFGSFFSWAGVALSALASLGYFWAGDIRRALYFLFAALITATICW